jgi:rare lipoprotein A
MFEVMMLIILSHQPVQPDAQGIASYYTVASSSTLTASGEQMRDDLKTCAMLDGRFGEYYLVVAENGESVVCKLNDRGPYVEGRVIDLSEAAMSELDLELKAGVMSVKVYHIGSNPPGSPSV